MNKLIKLILLPLVLSSLLITGCDDLFSKGDTEKTYEGPDQVAFFPLQSIADEGTNVSIEVQFISENGLAESDVPVSISVVDSASSAGPDDYSLGSSSLTIPSGSATASFTVSLNADDDTAAEEVLVLSLEADGVEVAENLGTANIFIQGVN